MIFYFSGCGNSRFVAESLARELDETLVFIPDAERAGEYQYTLSEGEAVGFVFPIYSWRPPHLVSDFVAKLKFANAPSYVWFAVTCGDNAGMTEKVFRNELKTIGLSLNAAFCFVMPNTYINMKIMKLDTKRVAERKVAKAKKQLPEVVKAIAERQCVSDVKKGLFPRFKTNVIGKNFYRWVSDEPFFATDDCISCGKCAEVCPLNNITIENGRPRWNGNCTNCDACYHHCPKNAIQFGKASRGKGQYHF
ncbi:MAG: EFR1 family ferrodoxin [Bacteroidales bacterium]|nr:EFR1 family ferrodoxin [Bacteroidales bacterium]